MTDIPWLTSRSHPDKIKKPICISCTYWSTPKKNGHWFDCFKIEIKYDHCQSLSQKYNTNKSDDTNEEVFMVNRCSQSAYIFFVISMGHTGYCQSGISICRIQNNRIKHSTWTSIIIAVKYLNTLQTITVGRQYKTFFIVQNWCAMDLLKILLYAIRYGSLCIQYWCNYRR